MAGLLAASGRRCVVLLLLCVLAMLPAGCASTSGVAVRPPHRGDVEAAFLVLERQREASLRNGPGYSLTVLDGLIAAHDSGAEGADAATLWRAEIERQYRARRWTMRAALEREIWGYDRARVDVILGRRRSLSPDAPPGAPDDNSRMAVSFFNTLAYRRASIDSLCASMRSTPHAWCVRYPHRAPFSFARFGINEPGIAQMCAARDLP